MTDETEDQRKAEFGLYLICAKAVEILKVDESERTPEQCAKLDGIRSTFREFEQLAAGIEVLDEETRELLEPFVRQTSMADPS